MTRNRTFACRASGPVSPQKCSNLTVNACMYVHVCVCIALSVSSVPLTNCKVTSGTSEVRLMSTRDRPSAPLSLSSPPVSEASDVIKTTQSHKPHQSRK